MNRKSIFDRLLHFIFPPRCENCDCLLDEDTLALCPECRAAWENEKRETCHVCGKPHVYCECGIDCYRYYHLLPYHPDRYETIARKLILTAKERVSRDLLRFEARELSSLLLARDALRNEYIVTFVPRSYKSKIEYGFDQTELLAKELAKELSYEFAPLISHRGHIKQKTLSAEERVENAEEAYDVDGDRVFYARGKRIILLDDVVTTGSSMISCAKQLRRAGAVEILLLSVARTSRLSK